MASTSGTLNGLRKIAQRIVGIGLLCLMAAALLPACDDDPPPEATSLTAMTPLSVPTSPPTLTPTDTPAPTPSPEGIPRLAPTATAPPFPTVAATPEPTPTATPAPTPTPTAIPTPTATGAPTPHGSAHARAHADRHTRLHTKATEHRRAGQHPGRRPLLPLVLLKDTLGRGSDGHTGPWRLRLTGPSHHQSTYRRGHRFRDRLFQHQLVGSRLVGGQDPARPLP